MALVYSEKQLHKVLQTSGTMLTGQTKKMISPLTGKLQTYHRTLGIYVTAPTPTTPNIDAVRTQIDNDLITQSVDGFCDAILVIQGVTNDTYKPSVWIAEDQPLLEARLGKQTLIAPLLVYGILIAISIIAASIAAVIIVIVITNSFTQLGEGLLDKPSYVGGTPENPEVYSNWAEYLSSQHNLYWYVCPKCGAGFGLKLDYATVEDVPQLEVDVFNEHVDICLGIPQQGASPWPFLLFAALGVGALISVAWIITKVIASRKK